VERVRSHWGYAIFGDSASAQVLETARIKNARLLVVAISEPVSASVTVQHARSQNPSLHIVSRVGWREEADELRKLGVAAVVWPEMEAALEMLRVSLIELGIGGARVTSLVDSARTTLEFGDQSGDELHDPYAGLW
jgi:Trk K+ transport system NAD-binding subunit